MEPREIKIEKYINVDNYIVFYEDEEYNPIAINFSYRLNSEHNIIDMVYLDSTGRLKSIYDMSEKFEFIRL